MDPATDVAFLLIGGAILAAWSRLLFSADYLTAHYLLGFPAVEPVVAVALTATSVGIPVPSLA